MRLILDATPLIHLSKVGFPFEKLAAEIITTGEVLKEIFAADFPENVAISNMLGSKLKVENPKNILKGSFALHKGGLSVISLARETDSIAVIDDRVGRAFAKSLKVKTIYSAARVIAELTKKIMTRREAKNFIDPMIANGWRCDVTAYKEILAKIEGAK